MLAALVVSVTSVALVTAGAFVASATVGSRPTIMTAVPEAPYTTFTLDGRPGANLVYGARIIDPVVVSAAQDGYLFFRGSQIDSMKAVLRPPLGASWVAGQTYETHDQEPTASRALLEIYGEGQACNTGTGSFPGTLTVHEVEYSGSMVTVFAASYAFWCGWASDAVAGELRWNSSVGWKSAVPEPALVDFGTVTADQPAVPVTVTLTSRGSSTITFGSARVEHEQASDFSVTADGCNGVTLEYGETCTVTVVASPHEVGGRSTFLIVPDDTRRGYRYVELRANIAGVPPITTTGTPPVTTTSPPPTTPPAPPAWDNQGTFYPLEPARILDTREGNGAPKAKLGAGKELVLDVGGRGGVPGQGVSAVVLNVTVTNPTAASFLTVYPAGQSRPLASSLNFVSGWTGANMVTVGLGSGGAVRIYNLAGTVDVIADVVGFYAADGSMVASLGTGSHYNPTVPFRVFDSRDDWNSRLKRGFTARVPLPASPEWARHITAVVVNLTAVDAVAPGFLTTWDGVGDPPLASTLNFVKGNVVPNMAIVPVSWCDECDGAVDGVGQPTIGVYTNMDTHVIVDVMGVYDDAALGEALRFAPTSPQRIADSRTGQGLPGALSAGRTRTVVVPQGIADVNTWGVALNVTAVDPTAYGFVSVWPEIPGVDRPLVSNLNTAPGQTLPNSVYTLIGFDYGFNVYNHDGRTHLVIDVVGTFYFTDDEAPASLSRAPQRGESERQFLDESGPALLQRSGRNGYAVG